MEGPGRRKGISRTSSRWGTGAEGHTCSLVEALASLGQEGREEGAAEQEVQRERNWETKPADRPLLLLPGTEKKMCRSPLHI